MSAPVISGAALIVREYFMKVRQQRLLYIIAAVCACHKTEFFFFGAMRIMGHCCVRDSTQLEHQLVQMLLFHPEHFFRQC